MDFLLAYISLTVGTRNATLLETSSDHVRDIAEKYLADRGSIKVITEKNDFFVSWVAANFKMPISINYCNDSGFLDLRVSEAVIIYLAAPLTQNLTNILKWNADTKFLIITDRDCAEDLINYLSDIQACRILVLSLANKSVNICIAPSVLCHSGVSIGTSNLYDTNVSIHDYVLEPSLRDCTVNISFMDLPPFVIFKGSREMGGNEGAIIATVLESLKIVPNYVNRHETGWGGFDPPTGLLGDVAAGNSFMGFGGLYPFEERVERTDLVTFCMPIDLGWVVPKGAGKGTATSLIILISEFSPFVWAVTLFTACTLIIVSRALSKISLSSSFGGKMWFLPILAVTLGIPTRTWRSKIFMISCIVYGFILTSMYKSLMSSKLTAPPKIPEIDTLEQLRDSQIVVTGPKNSGLILQSGGLAKAIMNELSAKFQPNESSLNNLIQRVVLDRDSAVLRQTLSSIYVSLTNPVTAGIIHITHDSVSSFKSFALLKRRSCFTQRVSRKILQICESGIVSKSLKDALNSRETETSNHLRKLTLNDITGCTLMLFLGCIISLMTFIVELFKPYILRNISSWSNA